MKKSFKLFSMFILIFASRSFAASTNGAWTTTYDSRPVTIVLQDRGSNRILGALPGETTTYITGGTNSGANVTINFTHTDPSGTSTGSFVGTWSGTTSIVGTYSRNGSRVAMTLTKSTAPVTFEHWNFVESTSGAQVSFAKVKSVSGALVSGAFASVSVCTFIDCAGVITGWTVTTGNHSITADATTLTGTFSSTTKKLSGTYANSTSSGTFTATKDGLSNVPTIRSHLLALANFADAIEAESTTAFDFFHTNYLNNGWTKSQMTTDLAAVYANYSSLNVAIDGIRYISTIQDSEVYNPDIKRIEWRMIVTGYDSTGTLTTVFDQTYSSGGDEELFWMGTESSKPVTVGNWKQAMGAPYANVSDISSIPEAYSDSTTAPWGFVHNGIDFKPAIANMPMYAVFAGVVRDVTLRNNTSGYQVNVRIDHTDKYMTEYAFETFSTSPADGASQLAAILVSAGGTVTKGQKIGTLYKVGTDAHVHFGLSQNSKSVCPESFFQTSPTDPVSEIETILNASHTGAVICYP